MANDERIKNLCNRIEAEVRAMVITEQAPVADAETLEDLVKIVYDAVWQCAMAKPKWEYIEEERKTQWRSAVTAVLRAARPTLSDIDYARVEDLIAQGGGANYAPLWDYIESCIRYRVEVPSADCPTCAEKDQEIEALMVDIRAHADAQSDLVTALGRANAETKEAWEKYKSRDNQYLECHRQMQAAQTRVTELEYQINATCARVRAALEGEK